MRRRCLELRTIWRPKTTRSRSQNMRCSIFVLAIFFFAGPAVAQHNDSRDAGDDLFGEPEAISHPVAIRWWGQGMVSIETYWNLTIVIDPYNDKIGYEVPDLTADLV